MALKPRPPDKNNPADVERYKADMKHWKAHPEKWGCRPSIVTQAVQSADAKKIAVGAASKSAGKKVTDAIKKAVNK